MTEESLQTLSKEQLFKLMIQTMDEMFVLLKANASEDELDQKTACISLRVYYSITLLSFNSRKFKCYTRGPKFPLLASFVA